MSKINCVSCGRYVEEGLTPGHCYSCIDDSGDGPAARYAEDNEPDTTEDENEQE